MSYRNCLENLKPYVPGRPIEAVKKMYGLKSVVKLASNENPYGCSMAAREAVLRASANMRLYPDGACTSLRAALAGRHSVQPEQIVFGAGTDEVIAMLGKIFIEPGDECITASVTFPQYASAVMSMGGKMVYAPGENFGFNLDAIPALITERTKLIFIANPNNPSGTYHSAEAQEKLMAAVPPRVTVVFDEAYQEYVTAADYPNTLETLRKYDNAVLMKTFSKIYGLAAMRVGYGIMSANTATQMEKIRCPFNVSDMAQAAALVSLQDERFVERSRLENKKVMTETKLTFAEMGLPFIPSQANFIAVNLGKPSTEMFERLMANGYIVRSGVALGLPDGYQRITIGTPREMDGLIAVLKKLI